MWARKGVSNKFYTRKYLLCIFAQWGLFHLGEVYFESGSIPWGSFESLGLLCLAWTALAFASTRLKRTSRCSSAR